MGKKDNKAVNVQLEAIKRHKLNPALYVVQSELPNSLILRHRITGDIKVIEK